ncbi:uncharacterized protein [Macrobrachium rosenbergii]|uniref:uncharacterized protein n=1 Tax=Macrobrachium rosenbergii TaxID=79674 RepID=UPI0034D39EAD
MSEKTRVTRDVNFFAISLTGKDTDEPSQAQPHLSRGKHACLTLNTVFTTMRLLILCVLFTLSSGSVERPTFGQKSAPPTKAKFRDKKPGLGSGKLHGRQNSVQRSIASQQQLQRCFTPNLRWLERKAKILRETPPRREPQRDRHHDRNSESPDS